MKRKIFLPAVLLLLIIYILVEAVGIYRYGYVDERQKCDVAIVLGAATDSRGVSPVYAERINHGINLWRDGIVDFIILTGGKADNAEQSDAQIAKEYALSQGMPEEVIYTEDVSKITQENLKYSKSLMTTNGWDTCIIVSDPLHMKRSMLMAEDYDMIAFSSPTPTTRYRTWKTKLPFLLREEFFYIGYKIYRLFCCW